MAKPFGFGSVKIHSKLYVSGTEERYSTLQSEWNNKMKEEEIQPLIKKFEKDIKEQIKFNGSNLWEHSRLKELRTILDFSKSQLPEKKFRYMSIQRHTGTINPKTGREQVINEFAFRNILSQPTVYIKQEHR
jgi:hypothetical protein